MNVTIKCPMNIIHKQNQLVEIYDRFEKDMQSFKKDAFCKAGCSFCCNHFGNVDMITLEGLRIVQYLRGLPKQQQKNLQKKIDKNKKDRENQKTSPCPFLKADKTCLIYEVRPYSCRRLYSVKKCGHTGPTVHRQAIDLHKETLSRLQSLDSAGYSGHMTYILHLLRQPDFFKLYLSGGFNPVQIAAYGKDHGIIINCSRL
jgi:uncharacterized protein